MAAQIAAGAARGPAGGRALVAVPSHPRHGRPRGSDQARIAAPLGRRTGRPVARCLVRGRPRRRRPARAAPSGCATAAARSR